MARVEAPPIERTVPVVRALLLAVALTSAVTVAGAALAEQAARIPLLLGGLAAAVAIAALSVVAVRRRLDARDLEHGYATRLAYVEHRLAGHEYESERIADDLLPRAIEYLKKGVPVRQVMRDAIDESDDYRHLSPARRRIVESTLKIVEHEVLQREGAQYGFVGIARRVQTIAAQQAVELREMEEDHGLNPQVFDDLLRIDHGNALIGRLVDSIAVMGGHRPGRTWRRNVALFSVLRGAMSRILEYPRIQLGSIAKVSVVGPDVEAVIHVLAELLDNATRYSPPNSKVHVTASEVQSGVAIEIEDGGMNLTEENRVRAEGMLERAMKGTDLNDLGESPRLGLAVVGRLCTLYNLKVSLRQSAYGGLRAVLVVPRASLGTGPAPGIAHGIGVMVQPGPDGKIARPPRSHGRPPKSERKPRPKPAVPASATHMTAVRPPAPRPGPMAMEDDEPVVTEWTEDGLPQRRSRVRAQLDAPATAPAPAPRSPQHPARHAKHPAVDETERPQPGIRVEAFINAAKGVPQEPSPARESGESRDEEDLT